MELVKGEIRATLSVTRTLDGDPHRLDRILGLIGEHLASDGEHLQNDHFSRDMAHSLVSKVALSLFQFLFVSSTARTTPTETICRAA